MAVIRRKKPYESQLNRVKRIKGRINNNINDYRNGKLTADPLELADLIYYFFTCCDHMKDFINNDDTLDIDQSPYDYLNENECLRKCRDISVGTKHLKIDRPKTEDGPFKINFVTERDNETGDIFFDVNIKSNTVKENFFSLANECIEKWEYYINKEITSKPKNQIKINCPNCKKDFEVDEDLIMCDCPNCEQKNILTGIKK